MGSRQDAVLAAIKEVPGSSTVDLEGRTGIDRTHIADAARKLRTYGFVRSEMHLRPDCNGHLVMQRCWYPIY